MKRARPVLASIVVIVAVGAGVVADPSTASGPVPSMAAAGRVGSKNAGGCSAILVAPDLVVSAAHCLSRARGRHDPDRPGVVGFRTGAYPGKASTFTPAAEVIVHPLYEPEGPNDSNFPFDVALMRLSRPVPAEFAVPVPLGPPPEDGERLLIASWPGGRGDRARERMCTVIGHAGRLSSLFCLVVSGESGSPAIRLTKDGPEVAAIVVGKTRLGVMPIAFAAHASPRVTQIRALMPGGVLEGEISYP